MTEKEAYLTAMEELKSGNVDPSTWAKAIAHSEGEEDSLHALTQKLLDTERQLRPSPYWTHEGERLIDIYDKTYDVY